MQEFCDVTLNWRASSSTDGVTDGCSG